MTDNLKEQQEHLSDSNEREHLELIDYIECNQNIRNEERIWEAVQYLAVVEGRDSNDPLVVELIKLLTA